MASTATSPIPGAIEPGVMFTLDEIKRRSKLGEWALRTARRNGLRVIYTGGRAFVRGQDFVEYLDRIAGGQNGSE